MILNERQYVLTKAQIAKFERTVAKLNSQEPPLDLNSQLRHQAHLEALNSQLESLKDEVAEYDELKAGTTKILKFNSLEELPEALIKARIIRGWTQEDLANNLGLKPQQIQRYEASRYAGASLNKLVQIKKALNLETVEEMTFK